MSTSRAAMLPYVLPYAGFLLVLEVGRWLPDGARGGVLLAQVALPAALLVAFWRKGAFAELRGPRPAAATWAADVPLGLAIAALWTLPYLAIEALPGPPPEGAFDPSLLGAGREPLAWVVRGVGFALVTPFVEELFVRSFLWRWIAAGVGGDFRQVPVGAPDRRAALLTTLVFAATHLPWEWPVALPTGALLAAWLWRARDLRACVRAHAVANASLFTLAWAAPERFAVFL